MKGEIMQVSERKLNRLTDALEAVLAELREQTCKTKKRYVIVQYIDLVRKGLNPTQYVYIDPWGDLEAGSIVARPSGIAYVVDVDVLPVPNVPALVARYRREEYI
jgi:hypothetical protein